MATEICYEGDIHSEQITWDSISETLGYSYKPDKASILSLLYALLCRAVSDTCKDKTTYVSRIIELDKRIQMVLMQIIKQGEEMKEPAAFRSPHPDESYLDDLNIDEDNESLLDDFDDNMNKENIVNSARTPLSVSTSLPKKSPLSYRSPRFTYRSPMASGNKNHQFNLFSGSRGRTSTPLSASPHGYNQAKIMQLENENVQLKDSNEVLISELTLCQRQENMLRAQLEEIEAKNRAIQLKIETDNLAYNSKLRDEYDEKIQSMERKLQKSERMLENAASMEEELSTLRDEVDVLQSCKTKLIQAEEQVRKMKSKMEKMGDLSEVLANEEKAHAEAVAKCLELENSLAVLAPLKRQLEEYKIKATDAEVKLVECEDEIKKLKESGYNMNGLNKELQVGSLRQQAEVEELRRQIQEENIFDDDSNKLGHGISEMNPAVKEELLHLRNENKRLKQFAAKREDDAVQMIEEKLDDANRLAAKFKEQFLSTKSSLEQKSEHLVSSLNRESLLKQDIIKLNEQVQVLEKELEVERETAKLDKKEAEELLVATKQRMIEQHDLRLQETNEEWENQLKRLQEEWNSKHSKLVSEFEGKKNEHNKNMKELQDEMNQSVKKLEQQKEAELKQLSIKHEEKLEQVQVDYEKEREDLISKGKQLIQQINGEKDEKIKSLESSLNKALDEQEQLIEKQREYEQKVTKKLAVYKQKINVAQTEAQEANTECEDLQEKLKKVEREKSSLQDENDRFRRQMTGRAGFDQVQYEALQREYNSVLEENLTLKNMASQDELLRERNPGYFGNEGHVPFSSTNNIHAASSISQFRAEYEEKIEELCDERRQLIMKNSALITDEKRATSRSWDLEVQVKDLQEKNTSLQLQIERLQRNTASATKKRVASKVSPKTLTKASEAWRSSKMAKANASPCKSIPSPTVSTIPNLDMKSPEFQNSISKFRTKLINKLSSTKKDKNKRSVLDEFDKQLDDQWEIHL